MRLFKETNAETGTAKNSVLALVFSILALASISLYFLFGINMIMVPAVFWGLAVFQVQKGLHSDNPRLAKVARILIFLGAAAFLVLCVLAFKDGLTSLFR